MVIAKYHNLIKHTKIHKLLTCRFDSDAKQAYDKIATEESDDFNAAIEKKIAYSQQENSNDDAEYVEIGGLETKYVRCVTK